MLKPFQKLTNEKADLIVAKLEESLKDSTVGKKEVQKTGLISDLFDKHILSRIENIFANSNSGYYALRADEFRAVIAEYMPPTLVDSVYRAIDVNDVGFVQYSDFTNYLIASEAGSSFSAKTIISRLVLALQQEDDLPNLHRDAIDCLVYVRKPIPMLISGGRDGQVNLWDLESLNLIASIDHRDKNAVYQEDLSKRLDSRMKAKISKQVNSFHKRVPTKMAITAVNALLSWGLLAVGSADCCVTIYELATQDVVGRLTDVENIPTYIECFQRTTQAIGGSGGGGAAGGAGNDLGNNDANGSPSRSQVLASNPTPGAGAAAAPAASIEGGAAGGGGIVQEEVTTYLAIGDSEGLVHLVTLHPEFGSSTEVGMKKKNQVLFAKSVEEQHYILKDMNQEWITQMHYIAEVNALLSSSNDGLIAFIDVNKRELIKTFTGHKEIGSITAFSWSALGKYVVSASERILLFWDPFTLEVISRIDNLRSPVVNIDVCDYHNKIFVALTNKNILVWHNVTFELLQTVIDTTLYKPVNAVSAITFALDRNTLFSAGHKITSWNLEKSSQETEEIEDEDLCNVLYNSLFNQVLIVKSLGTLKIFQAENGEIARQFMVRPMDPRTAKPLELRKDSITGIYQPLVLGACLDKNQTRLIVTGIDLSIQFWSVHDGSNLISVIPQLYSTSLAHVYSSYPKSIVGMIHETIVRQVTDLKQRVIASHHTTTAASSGSNQHEEAATDHQASAVSGATAAAEGVVINKNNKVLLLGTEYGHICIYHEQRAIIDEVPVSFLRLQDGEYDAATAPNRGASSPRRSLLTDGNNNKNKLNLFSLVQTLKRTTIAATLANNTTATATATAQQASNTGDTGDNNEVSQRLSMTMKRRLSQLRNQAQSNTSNSSSPNSKQAALPKRDTDTVLWMKILPSSCQLLVSYLNGRMVIWDLENNKRLDDLRVTSMGAILNGMKRKKKSGDGDENNNNHPSASNSSSSSSLMAAGGGGTIKRGNRVDTSGSPGKATSSVVATTTNNSNNDSSNKEEVSASASSGAADNKNKAAKKTVGSGKLDALQEEGGGSGTDDDNDDEDNKANRDLLAVDAARHEPPVNLYDSRFLTIKLPAPIKPSSQMNPENNWQNRRFSTNTIAQKGKQLLAKKSTAGPVNPGSNSVQLTLPSVHETTNDTSLNVSNELQLVGLHGEDISDTTANKFKAVQAIVHGRDYNSSNATANSKKKSKSKKKKQHRKAVAASDDSEEEEDDDDEDEGEEEEEQEGMEESEAALMEEALCMLQAQQQLEEQQKKKTVTTAAVALYDRRDRANSSEKGSDTHSIIDPLGLLNGSRGSSFRRSLRQQEGSKDGLDDDEDGLLDGGVSLIDALKLPGHESTALDPRLQFITAKNTQLRFHLPPHRPSHDNNAANATNSSLGDEKAGSGSSSALALNIKRNRVLSMMMQQQQQTSQKNLLRRDSAMITMQKHSSILQSMPSSSQGNERSSNDKANRESMAVVQMLKKKQVASSALVPMMPMMMQMMHAVVEETSHEGNSESASISSQATSNSNLLPGHSNKLQPQPPSSSKPLQHQHQHVPPPSSTQLTHHNSAAIDHARILEVIKNIRSFHKWSVRLDGQSAASTAFPVNSYLTTNLHNLQSGLSSSIVGGGSSLLMDGPAGLHGIGSMGGMAGITEELTLSASLMENSSTSIIAQPKLTGNTNQQQQESNGLKPSQLAELSLSNSSGSVEVHHHHHPQPPTQSIATAATHRPFPTILSNSNQSHHPPSLLSPESMTTTADVAVGHREPSSKHPPHSDQHQSDHQPDHQPGHHHAHHHHSHHHHEEKISVDCLVLLPKAKIMIGACSDRYLRFWDLETNLVLCSCLYIDLTNWDQSFLLSAHQQGQHQQRQHSIISNISNPAHKTNKVQISSGQLPDEVIKHLQVSDSEDSLIAAYESGWVRVWSLQSYSIVTLKNLLQKHLQQTHVHLERMTTIGGPSAAAGGGGNSGEGSPAGSYHSGGDDDSYSNQSSSAHAHPAPLLSAPRASVLHTLGEFGDGMSLAIAPLALISEWKAHDCPILSLEYVWFNYEDEAIDIPTSPGGGGNNRRQHRAANAGDTTGAVNGAAGGGGGRKKRDKQNDMGHDILEGFTLTAGLDQRVFLWNLLGKCVGEFGTYSWDINQEVTWTAQRNQNPRINLNHTIKKKSPSKRRPGKGGSGEHGLSGGGDKDGGHHHARAPEEPKPSRMMNFHPRNITKESLTMTESPSTTFIRTFFQQRRQFTSQEMNRYVETLTKKVNNRPPAFLAADSQWREITMKHPMEVPKEHKKVDVHKMLKEIGIFS